MKMAWKPGDVVVVQFPGATEIKRRPSVILSSDEYHSSRPDIIVGLVTSQTAADLCPTDYELQDWKQAGLRRPSTFGSFIVTLPPAARPVVIGQLSERDWHGVCDCIRKALAPLDHETRS